MTSPDNGPRWFTTTLAVTIGAAALSGCGTHGHTAADSTTRTAGPTRAPASSTSPLAPPVDVPHGKVPAALVGTYTYRQYGTWHVTLRSDGTYSQWNDSGQLDITGHFGSQGHLAVFSDQATKDTHGSACPDPGAYRWHFVRTKLVMSVNRDDCTVGRIDQWTAGWKKVSTLPLDNAPTLGEAKNP